MTVLEVKPEDVEVRYSSSLLASLLDQLIVEILDGANHVQTRRVLVPRRAHDAGGAGSGPCYSPEDELLSAGQRNTQVSSAFE